MDHITKEKRTWNMTRITSKNTKPEIIVRSTLHQKGFRFRLHEKSLPGKPDIVLPKFKTVILVHGCFWHSHKRCKRSNLPKSNRTYWKNKLAKNVKRDRQNRKALKKMGFKAYVVWECQTNNIETVINKIGEKILTPKKSIWRFINQA